MLQIGRIGIIGGSGWLGTAISKALVRSGAITGGELTCSYRSKMPKDAVACFWTPDKRRALIRRGCLQ